MKTPFTIWYAFGMDVSRIQKIMLITEEYFKAYRLEIRYEVVLAVDTKDKINFYAMFDLEEVSEDMRSIIISKSQSFESFLEGYTKCEEDMRSKECTS